MTIQKEYSFSLWQDEYCIIISNRKSENYIDIYD